MPQTSNFLLSATNNAIHKATSFTVPGCSMISTDTIPVEQKSVHWLCVHWQEQPLGMFLLVTFWEWQVTFEPATL